MGGGGVQVLVEGPSRKDPGSLTGRTCTNKRVQIIGAAEVLVPDSYGPLWRSHPRSGAEVGRRSGAWSASDSVSGSSSTSKTSAGALPIDGCVRLAPGDYAAVEVQSAGAVSLEGVAVARTSLKEFFAVHGGAWSAHATPTFSSHADGLMALSSSSSSSSPTVGLR